MRPPVEHVLQRLRYDAVTGELTWLPFADTKGRMNTRYVDRPAGTLKPGEVQVALSYGGIKRLYRAHHLAFVIVEGRWPEGIVDHRDGNTHNNAWTNLRECNSSRNNCNRHRVEGRCRFRGVYFHRASGRYAAQIKLNGEHHWLGLHDTAEAAARAYDQAANSLHGEFAVTNHHLGLI